MIRRTLIQRPYRSENGRHTVLALMMLALAAGCSSGGSSTTDEVSDTSSTGGGVSNTPTMGSGAGVTVLSDPPSGTVTHYGAVSIGDEEGLVSDLLGSFYALDSGVSVSYLQSLVSDDQALCVVEDDGVIDFEDISTGYFPAISGRTRTAVSAGQNIIVSSELGTFATLTLQSAGALLFYEPDSISMFSNMPVPSGLTVDIPGTADVAPITMAAVPQVAVLNDFRMNTEELTVATRFDWEPSSQPDTFIRISTSTRGGFFLENGVTVSCTVPDSGTFVFPQNIRNRLGADFVGTDPIASRVSANLVLEGSTAVYLLRESFAM